MDLSNIPGLAAPIPPAAGPAAMVGQRPHMDYAWLPEQSMHELAVWSTAGGAAKPKPVALTVQGADDLLHWSEPFAMKRKYGHFGPNETNTAMINAPMSIKVEYDDGSTKDLQPADLTYTLSTPDGGTESITIGQELQEAWGGSRQLTVNYTEDEITVSTQLTVMIGEPVTDAMKLRFKIGMEIPEAARKDVIPELEANRLISWASDSFNPDLLFKVEENMLTIEPVANCFDGSNGKLYSGWLVSIGSGTNEKYLLRRRANSDGDEYSPSYYITEVISDPDYAWLGEQYSFRNGEFSGWTSLQYGLVEEPGTTAYAENYRASQYDGCSSLQGFKDTNGDIVERPEEATGVTLIGGSVTFYRMDQFNECSSLTAPLVEHSPIIDDSVITISNFRRYQYGSCSSLLAAAEEDPLPAAEHADITYFRGQQYSYCTSLTKSAAEHTYDMSGAVSALKATSESFRIMQFGYCTSLVPAAGEKVLERIVATDIPQTVSGTRFYKYSSTKASDANPFCYQGDDETPALQGDRWAVGNNRYVTQYYLYGGATTKDKYKLTAHTNESWKTAYTAGEELSLEGLSVDLSVNNKTVHTYTTPLPDGLTVTPPLGGPLDTSVTSVKISYKWGEKADRVVSTSVPITVQPATPPPEA